MQKAPQTRKDHPFVYPARYELDMCKVTGDQGTANATKIWNDRRKEAVKAISSFLIILMALTACATPQAQAGMTNPASVYCEQNGNELIPAADGIQSGLCVFPDGSACDEWAYYRRECCPAADNCATPAMKVEASGGGGPGESGSTEQQASGGYMPPGATERIDDWWGVIKATEPGSQYDDYFERQDLGQIIFFGIDSMDPAAQSQIKALRDSGKIVHLYGTLLSNVPDYNGSQLQVDRIEVEE